MNLKGLSSDSDIDYYGTFAVSLCYAAHNYDQDKGKFSTYLFRCMEHDLLDIQKKKNNYYYLYEEHNLSKENEDDSELFYEPSYNMEEELNIRTLSNILKKHFSQLKENHKSIIYDIVINKKTNQEVANKLNLSKQRVNQIYQNFKQKVLTEYYKENYYEN